MKHIGFIQNLFECETKLTPGYVKLVKNVKLNKEQDNSTNFSNQDKKFLEETNKILSPHILKIANFLGYTNYFFRNCWVQKYKKEDVHSIHIHSKGLEEYSFIYYIDGTKNSSPTLFYNLGYPYVEISHHKVSPEKGKLVFFLGCLPHEVRNNGDTKRLIVSGNIAFNNEK